jgi:hypothetical protein
MSNVRVFSRILAVFLVAWAAYSWITHKPFVQPHIKAPAYVPPRGCPWARGKDISNSTEISCSCAAKQYEFGDSKKYGLTFLTRRDHKFYRFWNDVIEIERAGHFPFIGKDVCIPGNYVSDAFYQ